jgi:formate dehydrogenase alpha subunit
MTNTFDDIVEDAQAYFIIGSNTTENHPVLGMRLRQAIRQRGVPLILCDPRDIPIAAYATLHVRHGPGTDIALLNGIMHVLIAEQLYDRDFVATRTEGFDALWQTVQAYTPERAASICGVQADDIRAAARLMAAHRPGALMYAMGITQHATGHDNVLACASLQMLLGNMGRAGGGVNPLRGQANVQGACDMGGLPDVYSGYQRVDVEANQQKFEAAWGVPLPSEVGLTLVEMMNAAEAGRMRGMYIVGENPVMSDPDANHVEKCLRNLDFLVVQDIFLTETARLADVVLPAAVSAEKDGTFTNSERRVQRVRPAVLPPGEARQDWAIVGEVARRMGYDGLTYPGPRAIFDEMASLTPSYAGLSWDRLEARGLQWPCPSADHPGTKILHVGKFSRGLGRFVPVEWKRPVEEPDGEYPYLFTTGRVLWHYHTGTQTRRSEGLNALYPEPLIEINANDARALNIRNGDLVRVTSRRGAVVVKALVGTVTGPGVVFMAFHFAEAVANKLTRAALDPTSKIPEYKVCAVKVEVVAP